MIATRTSLEHEIGSDGLFVLRLRGGTVRLHGVDGGLVRVSGDRDLEEVFTIERGPGSLALQVDRRFEGLAGLSVGIRAEQEPAIEVEVPRRATVVFDGTNAELAAESLVGDQRYRTVSGDLALSSVGGTIAVQGVSGDLRVVATDELGLEARTVSGDLDVRAGRISRLSVATTSGDVRIAGELGREGRHRIHTVSGDMLIAAAGGVRLESTTVAGDVRASVPHRTEGGRGRRVLIIGTGDATLETRSMSGSVRVVEAHQLTSDEATPPPPPQPSPAHAPPAPEPPPVPLDPIAAASSAAIGAAYDDQRLRILRSLERGEIDVAEAGRRLERLDAGDVMEDGR